MPTPSSGQARPPLRSLEPIDLGPFEDATPATVLFLRRHALFGGVSGSGKSGGLNVLMANLSACADVVIWAIDLKRGMELGPWAPCIARLATTPAQARASWPTPSASLKPGLNTSPPPGSASGSPRHRHPH